MLQNKDQQKELLKVKGLALDAEEETREAGKLLQTMLGATKGRTIATRKVFTMIPDVAPNNPEDPKIMTATTQIEREVEPVLSAAMAFLTIIKTDQAKDAWVMVSAAESAMK